MEKQFVVVRLTQETHGYGWEIVPFAIPNHTGTQEQAEKYAYTRNSITGYAPPYLFVAVQQSTWQKKAEKAAVLVKALKAYTDKLEQEKQDEQNAVPCVEPSEETLRQQEQDAQDEHAKVHEIGEVEILDSTFRRRQQVQIVGTPYMFAINHGGFMKYNCEHCDKQVQAETVKGFQDENGMLDIKGSQIYIDCQLEIAATKTCTDYDLFVCYQPMNIECDFVVFKVMRTPAAPKTLQMQPAIEFFNAKLAEKAIMDILYPDGVPTVPDCDFCDMVLSWTKADIRLQPLQNILCGAICDFMEAEEVKHQAEAQRLADEANAAAIRQEKEKREAEKRYTRLAEIIAETKKTHPFFSEELLSAMAGERYDYELKAEAKRLELLSPKEAEVLQRNMKHEKRGTVAEPSKKTFANRQERKESYAAKQRAKRLSQAEATITPEALDNAADIAAHHIEGEVNPKYYPWVKDSIKAGLQERADWATKSYMFDSAKRNDKLCGTNTVNIMVIMLQNLSEAEVYVELDIFGGTTKNVARRMLAISEYVACQDMKGLIAANQEVALKRYNQAKEYFLPEVELVEPIVGGSRFVHAILTLSELFEEFNRLCGFLQLADCKMKDGSRIIDLFR